MSKKMSEIIDEIVYLIVKTNLPEEEKRKIFQLIRILRVQISIKEKSESQNVPENCANSLDS
jgi:uncharacterized membrane protein YqgA involved in biofilm formation